MRPRFLNRIQVLARMHRGDLPISCGGYSDAAVFADGARARHISMYRLIKEGKVNRPVGTCCTNPYTVRATIELPPTWLTDDVSDAVADVRVKMFFLWGMLLMIFDL